VTLHDLFGKLLNQVPHTRPPGRVLFITGQLTMGGAERQLTVLGPALVKHGTAVDVVAFNDGPCRAALIDGGVTVHLVNEANVKRIPRLVSLIRQTKPDVIVAWHFYIGAYAAAAATLTRTPWVAALQSSLGHEWASSAKATRLSLKLAPVIMANSHGAVAEVKALGKRVGYLPNGVDVAKFGSIAEREASLRAKIADAAKGRPVVAAVGVCRPEKRFERFVQMVAECRSQGQPVFGVIMGDGPERPSLERQATDLGLSDADLLFAGMVADIPAALSAVDLATLTSSTEGTPNVLLEALGAGKPFVSTDVGDARVVSERSGVGVISDVEATILAANVIKVLNDEAACETARTAGPAFLEREHSVLELPRHFEEALQGSGT
jgi:glycosyltransferase involved in cell wall biosynthesis